MNAYVSGAVGAAAGIGFLVLVSALGVKDNDAGRPEPCLPKHAKERAVIYLKGDGKYECHIHPVGIFGEFDGKAKI